MGTGTSIIPNHIPSSIRGVLSASSVAAAVLVAASERIRLDRSCHCRVEIWKAQGQLVCSLENPRLDIQDYITNTRWEGTETGIKVHPIDPWAQSCGDRSAPQICEEQARESHLTSCLASWLHPCSLPLGTSRCFVGRWVRFAIRAKDRVIGDGFQENSLPTY